MKIQSEFPLFEKFTLQFEKKIEANQSLKNLDEELKVTHVEMLSRFYKLFETVHGYAIDFKNYLNELEEGRFIQNSIETLFLDMDGKQLLCESLFLYGIMLLALDVHIEGQVREKLLVAYFRYSGMYVSMKLVTNAKKGQKYDLNFF